MGLTDQQILKALREKYEDVKFIGSRAHRPKRCVVVRIATGNTFDLQCRVYAGNSKSPSEWVPVALVEPLIKAAQVAVMRPVLEDNESVYDYSDAYGLGVQLLKDGKATYSKACSRWQRVRWPDRTSAWLRFSPSTAGRMRKSGQETLEAMMSEGVYAWVVQFWIEKSVMRLRYSLNFYFTPWVETSADNLLMLVRSGNRHADEQGWRSREIGQ